MHVRVNTVMFVCAFMRIWVAFLQSGGHALVRAYECEHAGVFALLWEEGCMGVCMRGYIYCTYLMGVRVCVRVCMCMCTCIISNFATDKKQQIIMIKKIT